MREAHRSDKVAESGCVGSGPPLPRSAEPVDASGRAATQVHLAEYAKLGQAFREKDVTVGR